MAVGRRRPRASSDGHVAHLHRAAEVRGRLFEQLADGEGGHADRVDSEDEEAAVGVEQPGAIGDEAGEPLLQLPHLAAGAAAKFGGIEDDDVIAAAAANVAGGDLRSEETTA